jgi:hypothetical protein
MLRHEQFCTDRRSVISYLSFETKGKAELHPFKSDAAGHANIH